jgi:3-hydroxymyristoyl/3-hydroxydecanoyl-(acyl carrier protein) dehydratase
MELGRDIQSLNAQLTMNNEQLTINDKKHAVDNEKHCSLFIVHCSLLNIEELLPQKKPFIAIDRMIHFDAVATITVLKIAENSIFVEDGFFTETGIMENIAQTCAARMGYINKHLQSGKVKIGFIGSIKNLIIEELPRVGDELKTTIEVFSEIFAITLVNAKVEVADKLIASCEMKIAITDIET